MKKTLIALLVLFAVLFIFTSFGSSKSLLKKSGSISPNILYLTKPVTSFSGKVEKIAGNKITVSQQLTSSNPTPQTTTIAYLVTITDKTQIIRLSSPGSPPPADSQPTIKDIKAGQLIMVNTTNDLRTMTGNKFEATTVSLPPVINILNGQIISLEENVLTIKGTAVIPALPDFVNNLSTAPQEKDYRISLTPDTEISQSSFIPTNPGEPPQPLKNEKLSSSDLKKDMQVTVYTAQDVNENSELTALRIRTTVQPPL